MSPALTLTLMILVSSQSGQTDLHDPPANDVLVIREKMEKLNDMIIQIQNAHASVENFADLKIYSKAAEWILRHHEFFEPKYSQWTIDALDKGLKRVRELANGRNSWFPHECSAVLGYYSQVDESIQPYAVTLPQDYADSSERKWPLHVVLHGRNSQLNEVSFIHEFDRVQRAKDLDWVQLDVFGRTNNGYRWSGETDVFEALSALKRRVRIDESRITLRGFSMGGAGTWHIGLHYPSLWCSVAAGAGFVDTVHHLNLDKPLSPLSQKLTRIYDAEEYAMNAFNVPTIGYGGELDPQLYAAKTMHRKGQELGVSIELLIGPQTGHQFHTESLKKYMSFIAGHSKQGRLQFPNRSQLRFVTCTVKYNSCEWLSVEEQIIPYEPSVVESEIDIGTKTMNVRTKNVAVLQINRNFSDRIVIDGSKMKELPASTDISKVKLEFSKTPEGWQATDEFESSKHLFVDSRGGAETTENRHEPEKEGFEDFHVLRKRHNLQGPIDDAFMQPFLCVRPTGTAWSNEQTNWAKWTLNRFEREFDKRLRGRIPVVDDHQVTDEQLAKKNLILFGDPGSNRILGKILQKLPIKWSKEGIEVNETFYSSSEHGFAMIYPNPLNPQKYVVVNSGHTFHETEFVNSNATLYPRLGDIGVIRFAIQPDGEFVESLLFSTVLNSHWQFENR